LPGVMVCARCLFAFLFPLVWLFVPVVCRAFFPFLLPRLGASSAPPFLFLARARCLCPPPWFAFRLVRPQSRLLLSSVPFPGAAVFNCPSLCLCTALPPGVAPLLAPLRVFAALFPPPRSRPPCQPLLRLRCAAPFRCPFPRRPLSRVPLCPPVLPCRSLFRAVVSLLRLVCLCSPMPFPLDPSAVR